VLIKQFEMQHGRQIKNKRGVSMHPMYTRVTLALSVALLAHGAAAQSYPAKAVRIMAPFAAGGPTDMQARWAAQQLSNALGQPFVVENRTGAAGILAADAVAKSAPDGYTLLVGNAGPLSIASSVRAQLPYDVVNDFAPITLIAKTASCMCVHPSVPAKGIKEFIALAKTQPARINYGTSGVGTVGHLAIELLAARGGIKLTHVPYKGATQVVIDQLSGNIELSSLQFAATVPYVKQGRLRALGVTSAKRSALMPEIPTIAEQGVPGYDAVNWAGLLARKGTPPAIVARLHEILKAQLATAEAGRLYTDQGHDIVAAGPAEFEKFLRAETAQWAKVVKTAGIPRE
jgi:tripartite-type tricarboxylate transporter receptor subunit TctC